MFRKKDTDTEAATGSDSILRRPVGENTGKPGAQTELPRRKVDLPGAGAGGDAAETSNLPPTGQTEPDRFAGKRLIVGEGIRLSGEISSCDRLLVEGAVEVTLNDTLALEIAESGRFTGGCEVEEADISGVYEGDLTVRKRLIVRGSGKLTGTIRYGELELERGGQIAGNISVLSAAGGNAGGGSIGAEERSRSPAFGETGIASGGSSKL